MYVCMYVALYSDECVYVLQLRCFYRLSINKLARKKKASMDKPAINFKYINSRITSFFDVLGKANHRPNCADKVILTRSDDLVQPTIG